MEKSQWPCPDEFGHAGLILVKQYMSQSKKKKTNLWTIKLPDKSYIKVTNGTALIYSHPQMCICEYKLKQ